MMIGWLSAAGLNAALVTPNTRDTLVYKDGDRVQGVLVEQRGDTIVFKSERFGELRVRAADAVVIKAEKESAAAKPAPVAPVPPAITPAEKKEAVAAAEREEQERVTIWDRFSPSVLTARVRDYFGPWHGRVSFSTEVVSDVAPKATADHRDSSSLFFRPCSESLPKGPVRNPY
jgi:hypothetical protein